MHRPTSFKLCLNVVVIMEGIANGDVCGKTLKITDFDQIKEYDHTTTMSGAGTYAWMAPEVFTKRHFSKASDVWRQVLFSLEKLKLHSLLR